MDHIHLRLAAALLGAAGLLSLTGPALASSTGVPFRATLSGTSTLTSPTSADFVGAGTADHMGWVASAGQIQAHPDLPNGSCPNGFLSTNDETLTAANGDTLSVHSEDVACPQGPGQFVGTGQWVVTGGTGRFAGVVGQGSFVGVVDFVAGSFSLTYLGTIGQ